MTARIQTQNRTKTVYVGMSGGVDSSVSAALLKEQGYKVVGVFIKAWEPEFAGRRIDCGWRDERREAMRVAALLEIPFITLDLSKEYKQKVVDYMLAEYEAGRTPNPDVMCNKAIKFGVFFDWAMKDGADYVATGHYARIKRETLNPKLKILNKPQISNIESYQLLAGVDKDKDQSYFLWTLGQKQLSKTLFPVGEFEKSEVRKLAKKFGLPNESKKDSQGICFIGKLDVKEFLRAQIKSKKGKVLDEQGKIIGSHDGAIFLTIGERGNFQINKQNPNQKPLYITAKNVKENTITVSDQLPEKTGETKAQLDNVNWINKPILNSNYKSRIRYRQTLQDCHITQSSNVTEVAFEVPQALASGQSLVIYDGNSCLGGGIII